jgi:hypothetical protein
VVRHASAAALEVLEVLEPVADPDAEDSPVVEAELALAVLEAELDESAADPLEDPSALAEEEAVALAAAAALVEELASPSRFVSEAELELDDETERGFLEDQPLALDSEPVCEPSWFSPSCSSSSSQSSSSHSSSSSSSSSSSQTQESSLGSMVILAFEDEGILITIPESESVIDTPPGIKSVADAIGMMVLVVVSSEPLSKLANSERSASEVES